MPRKSLILMTLVAVTLVPVYGQTSSIKFANDTDLVQRVDAAWAAWTAERRAVEAKLTAFAWETPSAFQGRAQRESLAATPKTMHDFDLAVAALRGAVFVEPADDVVLKVVPVAGAKDTFQITILGKAGTLAFEGSLAYQAKNAAEAKSFASPQKLAVEIRYNLFPLGDFGGQYREVARRVQVGIAVLDVLQIRDFKSGERRSATTARLVPTILVEGGGKVLDPYHPSADGALIQGPPSFIAASTLISQDVFLQVTGKTSNSAPSDRLDPWRAVDNVSWNDAVGFCNRLSQLDGLQPAFVRNSAGSFDVDLKASGWRLFQFEEFYYAAVGGTLARYRGQIGGDGAGFLAPPVGALPLVGDSPANEIGFRDIYAPLQFWESTGNRPDTRTTFALQGLSKFGGNFDLGSNLRSPGFSFRIVRNGVAK